MTCLGWIIQTCLKVMAPTLVVPRSPCLKGHYRVVAAAASVQLLSADHEGGGDEHVL